MSVILGKIVWSLLSPGSVLFGLLVVALLMSWWAPLRRWGRRLGVLILAIILILGVVPFSDWATRPLEEYYPVPELPASVDGIIVLGGAEEPLVSAVRHQPQVNGSADRLISFVGLARHYPDARLIFSGGGIRHQSGSLTEADVARSVLNTLGLDTSRVVFEAESRNTAENAGKTLALAKPQPGQIWLLVTSAVHMPRAVNCFRAVGWTVLPYPVDFQTGARPGFGFSPLGALSRLNGAFKEWAGLVAYRLLGHTREILPPHDLRSPGRQTG